MKSIRTQINKTLVILWGTPRWYARDEKINEEYRDFYSNHIYLFMVIESQLK